MSFWQNILPAVIVPLLEFEFSPVPFSGTGSREPRPLQWGRQCCSSVYPSPFCESPAPSFKRPPGLWWTGLMWVTGAGVTVTAMLIKPHLFPQVKLLLLETMIQQAVVGHRFCNKPWTESQSPTLQNGKVSKECRWWVGRQHQCTIPGDCTGGKPTLAPQVDGSQDNISVGSETSKIRKHILAAGIQNSEPRSIQAILDVDVTR